MEDIGPTSVVSCEVVDDEWSISADWLLYKAMFLGSSLATYISAKKLFVVRPERRSQANRILRQSLTILPVRDETRLASLGRMSRRSANL